MTHLPWVFWWYLFYYPIWIGLAVVFVLTSRRLWAWRREWIEKFFDRADTTVYYRYFDLIPTEEMFKIPNCFRSRQWFERKAKLRGVWLEMRNDVSFKAQHK